MLSSGPLYQQWITRFNPVQLQKQPLKANLHEEPRAMSALSRCFTLMSLILWAHGKGVDRSAQLTGSFPNRCGLVRWSRGLLIFQMDNEVAVRRTTLSPYRRLYCTHGWKRQLCSDLGNKTVKSKKKRLQNFWTQKPRAVQQPLPSYWNRGLFCQEGSALSIQSRIFAGKERTTGEQERYTCCLNFRRPDSWGRGRKGGGKEAPPQRHF